MGEGNDMAKSGIVCRNPSVGTELAILSSFALMGLENSPHCVGSSLISA